MRKNKNLRRLMLSRTTVAVLSSTALRAVNGAEQRLPTYEAKCTTMCPTKNGQVSCDPPEEPNKLVGGLLPQCPNN
jgi:hypothetical protein